MASWNNYSTTQIYGCKCWWWSTGGTPHTPRCCPHTHTQPQRPSNKPTAIDHSYVIVLRVAINNGVQLSNIDLWLTTFVVCHAYGLMGCICHTLFVFWVHFLTSVKHFTVSSINFCNLHCACSRAVGVGCVCGYSSVVCGVSLPLIIILWCKMVFWVLVCIYFVFFVFVFQASAFNFRSTFKVGAKNTSYL